MKRHTGLLIALTTIILLGVIYDSLALFNVLHLADVPFAMRIINGRTGVVLPSRRGRASPKGLQVGDHIDLAEQPLGTRILIATGGFTTQALPPGQVYRFVVHRGSERISVPVETIGREAFPGFPWLSLFESVFGGVIALAVVWRGRNLAAAGLALFAIARLLGISMELMPSRGMAGLAALLGSMTLFLLARTGLYIMAESMAGAALSPQSRRGWRTGFLVVLCASAVVGLVGPLVYVATGWGWAAFLPSPYRLIYSASYLVPVALLYVGYQRADTADRTRLRWMLGGGALFAFGFLVMESDLFGRAASIGGEFALDLGLAAFLYAILRHRVVDLTVVVSRTLVYAMTTSLVLGLFALFESVIERTALGHRASLMLELAVPLGLGFSLSTVHRRIDTLVDRLIFRHQYQEEVALRRFANESAFVSQPEKLLDLVMEQVLLHVGAPWVAYYEYTSEGYRLVRQRGGKDLPETVVTDDLALVKLRAHDSDVDLHEAPSGLGPEGYVFPLRARDRLLGVLVVGPRPSEHYAAEERKLMAHVAHAVGASLFALRARATEEQLSAAHAEIEASAARLDAACAQARTSAALLSDSRARESALLDALRALGGERRASVEQ
ncbi:MAG: GAF domain-containing protein [Steroidobacteraceae bacterium]